MAGRSMRTIGSNDMARQGMHQLTPSTRITWRTMHGTRSGSIVMLNERIGAYIVNAGGRYGTSAVVHPQDIIKIYNH